MKDVGTEFTDFLKAYGSDDYYKLGNPQISEAAIDAIFARHKANFDAWRRIPAEFKDAYGRAAPYMLEKAKTDPNFTANDARQAREEYHKNMNPYSPIPKSLEENEIYQDLLLRGIEITPAHIAAMKLFADELRRNGYSNTASEKVSEGFILRKGLFTERENILADSSLSPQEKEQRLAHADSQIDQTRLAEDKIKKDDAAINQPERMLMHTLRDFHRNQISRQEALLQVDLYVGQILATGRLSLLELEMEKSLYQKVLGDEQKQLLEKVLQSNESQTQTKQYDRPEPSKDAPQTQIEINLIAARNRIYGGRS